MKKRILSLILAATMLVLSSMAAFAAPTYPLPAMNSEAETFYEGNKLFELMEKILSELEKDKEADIFDKQLHAAQYDAISDLHIDNIDQYFIEDTIDWIISSESLTEHKKQYLVALVKAYGTEGQDNSIDASKDEIKTRLEKHDTSQRTMKGSFALLKDYRNEMYGLFNEYSILEGDYIGQMVNDSRWYIAEPLICVLKVVFAPTPDIMRENYYAFLTNDRAKKTLSILFGEELTGEIVNDTYLDDEDANENPKTGIIHHVIDYIKDNGDLSEFLESVESVMISDIESVDNAFIAVGDYVEKAYGEEESAGEMIYDSVIMLMGSGDETKPGLFERMVREIDEDLKASNVWINLLLSEFVQLTRAGGVKYENVSESKPRPTQIEISNGTDVYFHIDNLDEDFGLTAVPWNTAYFDIKCYNEDGSENTRVTYSDGEFSVEIDPAKSDYYDIYIVMYRGKLSEMDPTDNKDKYFIETYRAKVKNYTTPSGGGGGSTRYSVKYETNGGEAINSEYYSKGATVQLTKVPVREGYIFAGWYSDEALTQKVESVVMNGNITVYAAWTKDGSSVVSKVDVPDKLNGDEHFAYVIGYPEGDVRPQNNITRAEAVTILFRLLKDDVRNANVTDVNVFTDVNEGDWYNKAVSTLAALEIVNGRTETEFMPNEYITRAEFATIFARFSEFSYTVDDEFKDIAGHWAEEYINEAAAYGWIAGYEDNTFRPDNRITRAEAMTLINRVLKRNPENTNDLLEGMSVWTDNADTSAWYYIAVQEATNSHEYIKKNDSYEAWTKLTENRDWTAYEN